MAMSLPTVLAAFCLILPTLLVLFANASVPLLAASSAAMALLLWHRERRLPWSWLWPGPAIGLPLALLFAWSLATCLWALEPGESLYLLLRVASLVIAGLFLMAAVAALDEHERAMPRKAMLAGFAIAVAVVVLERSLGQPIYTTFGPTSPQHNLLSAMNRGATGLAILVWPVTALLARGRAGYWALLLPPVLLLPLSFLESNAAIFGLVAGALIAALALWRGTMGRRLLIAIVVATFVIMPIAFSGLYNGELARAPWLDYSSQHRTEIWAFSTDLIADKPLFGWGFDSADDMAGAGIATISETLRHLMPSHPHNAVVQIWLELGAVGAALALALMLAMVWRLDRLPPLDAAAAQATFLSCFSISLVSYGIWQSQWISTLLAAAAIMALVRVPGGVSVAVAAGPAGREPAPPNQRPPVERKAVEPKAVEPKAVEPKTVEPKTVAQHHAD